MFITSLITKRRIVVKLIYLRRLSGVIGLVLVATAFLWKGRPGHRYSVPALLLAALAGYIGLSAWARVGTAVSALDSELVGSVGSGVYLTVLAAVLAGIGALQRMQVTAEPPDAGDGSSPS